MLLLPILLVSLGCRQSDPELADELKMVSGHLRYEAGTKVFEAELILPDSSDSRPKFRDEEMRMVAGTGGRRFRYGTKAGLISNPSFTITDGREALSFAVPLSPVTIDSLADSLALINLISFEVADRGLNDDESIIVFFEPNDRGMPRRILVTGPTTSGTISLPTTATSDIPAGAYQVYLVKQRVVRARKSNVRISVQTEYFTPSKKVTVY